jgi:protein ImuB
MFRYLVAWMPVFRLERCGWPAQDAVVLVTEEKSALRVQAATPLALRRGIRVGMTLSEARARLPELQVERLDAIAEAADLEELSRQLLSISPAIAPLPPEALVAEVGRSAAAVTGERGGAAEAVLVERVRRRLAALGHSATVILADDPGTALSAAIWGGRTQVIPPGGGGLALAPLPRAALHLPLADDALLEGLGVRTVGAFAALDTASLVGRLSPLGVAQHALARGAVRQPLLAPQAEDTLISLLQELPDPVSELEALLFVIQALLREATLRLTLRAAAVSRVLLRFELDDGAHQEQSVRLGEPSRDPRRILTLLRERLERFKLARPVVGLRLELPEPAPFDGRQQDLLSRHREQERRADLTARLEDALGPGALIKPRLADRHRPEAAWAPATSLSAPPPREGPLSAALRDDPVQEWLGWPEPEGPSRPPLLLHAPEAIEVERQGIAPTAVHLGGGWLPVRGAEGPERLAGEWWESAFEREYWQLHLIDGRRAWVYREDGRWYLHGWWDR